MPPRAHLRLDIQALRALAIGMVFAVHLWPNRFPGGFAGVDVFFVISGFLITTHLLKELTTSGRIDCAAFYARRIRRLLPAALIVVLVSVELVVLFLPHERWEENLKQLAASAAYGENIYLTAMAVDYHAQGGAVSVAQHYWSLSVEEQFYLFWPLLLMLFWWLLQRFSQKNTQACDEEPREEPRAHTGFTSRAESGDMRRLLGALSLAILTVTVLSFIVSYWITYAAPHQAYFLTPVRLWEFACGACGAVTVMRSPSRLSRGKRLACVLFACAGLVLSLFVLNPTRPFPGYWALLPVISTLVILVQGVPANCVLTPLVNNRFIQWMGKISYSLYLWHWPLIIVLPFVLSHELTRWSKLGIAVVAFLLAGFTQRYVEEWGIGLKVPHRRVYGTMVCAVVCVLALCWGGIRWGQHQIEAEHLAQQERLNHVCVGRGALERPECAGRINDPLISQSLDDSAVYYRKIDGCATGDQSAYVEKSWVTDCVFSSAPAQAGENSSGRRTPLIYVIGDSHAQQWQVPLSEIASRYGWEMRFRGYGACSLGALEAGDPLTGCYLLQEQMKQEIAREKPDLVVTSFFAGENRLTTEELGGDERAALYNQRLPQTWNTWLESTPAVLVIEDTPLNIQVRSQECVSIHHEDPASCAIARERAFPRAFLGDAVRSARNERVKLLDFTRGFCDDTQCYAASGGLQIYFDSTHIQANYARQFMPELETQIRQLLPEGR